MRLAVELQKIFKRCLITTKKSEGIDQLFFELEQSLGRKNHDDHKIEVEELETAIKYTYDDVWENMIEKSGIDTSGSNIGRVTTLKKLIDTLPEAIEDTQMRIKS